MNNDNMTLCYLIFDNNIGVLKRADIFKFIVKILLNINLSKHVTDKCLIIINTTSTISDIKH